LTRRVSAGRRAARTVRESVRARCREIRFVRRHDPNWPAVGGGAERAHHLLVVGVVGEDEERHRTARRALAPDAAERALLGARGDGDLDAADDPARGHTRVPGRDRADAGKPRQGVAELRRGHRRQPPRARMRRR